MYACVCVLCCVQFFEASWTVAHQASLSMGFFKARIQELVPLPAPRDLPDLVIKPASPALAGGFFCTEPTGKPI